MTGVKMKQAKILEAVLFAAGEPVSLAKLAECLGSRLPVARNLLELMSEHYEKENAGIQLIQIEDSFQLCTNPKYHEIVQTLLPKQSKKKLTQPLLETLSIIAVKQPITKPEIEEIRGVSADHAVNKLLEFGLLEEKGRLDAPGRPILFGTSEDFLRYYGLKSVEEFKKMVTT